jgi:hypothetical protein
MKGRYTSDTEEGDMEQQQQQHKKNAPRKHDDGRFQDCNEHLYQAFQELHGLAQGMRPVEVQQLTTQAVG